MFYRTWRTGVYRTNSMCFICAGAHRFATGLLAVACSALTVEDTRRHKHAATGDREKFSASAGVYKAIQLSGRKDESADGFINKHSRRKASQTMINQPSTRFCILQCLETVSPEVIYFPILQGGAYQKQTRTRMQTKRRMSKRRLETKKPTKGGLECRKLEPQRSKELHSLPAHQ